ncbi:MAG: hypothetical protein IPG98_13465 [Burkholderiales bacterium]|nr:hypothetical protein [Burkholderiales bacterium]
MLGCTWLVLRRRDAWGLAALLILSAGLLFFTEFSTSWIQDPFVLYRSYLWAPMLCGVLAIVLGNIQPRIVYGIGLVLSLLLGALAWERVHSLRDVHSAWTDAIDKVDLQASANAVGRWRPCINRGAYYLGAKPHKSFARFRHGRQTGWAHGLGADESRCRPATTGQARRSAGRPRGR